VVLAARHRIRAVAELTGVPAATLRAWERRYGVPAPRRTSAAYRLYSDRDVELIRRMGDLVAAGVPPSEAARRLTATAGGGIPAAPAVDAPGDDDAIVAGLVDAIRALDPSALGAALEGLAVPGRQATVARVLRRALGAVGELWASGAITVAHEHLASHILDGAVRGLLRAAAPPADAPAVVLACFADEQHELPLLGAALEATAWGFRPVVLGARTPPDALAVAVASIRPALAGLSSTMTPSPDAARALLPAYAAACGAVPWVVGGAAAASMAGLVTGAGGHVAPDDPAAARALFDRLAPPR
jgi:DNA-binding transcriptional MerR regulator